MNLVLEKGERVTMGGKGRSEIGGEVGEVTGMVANVPTTDGLGKRYGTLMWTEMQKPDLSTKMSIFRKLTWEEKMVQVNQTG